MYTRRIVEEPTAGAPRSILMMQGIVDHYIMPTIADASSLSLGLDLAGPEVDVGVPEIAMFPGVGTLLDLVGRGSIPEPAQGNIGGKVTAVLTQFPSDGIEDGHEVVFQTEPPKHDYRCFLLTMLTGVPRVPSMGTAFDPCD